MACTCMMKVMRTPLCWDYTVRSNHVKAGN